MVPTTEQSVARVVEHLVARNPDLVGRLQRAHQLVQDGAVSWSEELGAFVVESQSNRLGQYTISLTARTCTCPDQPTRAPRGWCKHLLAVVVLGMADEVQARAALAVATSYAACQWRLLRRGCQQQNARAVA
jgi:hypothetical protein